MINYLDRGTFPSDRLLAFIYVTAGGWGVEITHDSEDLIRQIIGVMRSRGYPIPGRLFRRASAGLLAA